MGMFSFGEEPLNEGDMGSIQCAIIKGDSPVSISFFFENEPIVSGQNDMTILKSGKRTKQLNIESVKANHSGNYVCTASNAAGSVSRSALLTVNGTFI